jgi:hypothetical protein
VVVLLHRATARRAARLKADRSWSSTAGHQHGNLVLGPDDPRRVGGRYRCGYWGREYTVLAFPEFDDWRGRSITVRWEEPCEWHPAALRPRPHGDPQHGLGCACRSSAVRASGVTDYGSLRPPTPFTAPLRCALTSGITPASRRARRWACGQEARNDGPIETVVYAFQRSASRHVPRNLPHVPKSAGPFPLHSSALTRPASRGAVLVSIGPPPRVRPIRGGS